MIRLYFHQHLLFTECLKGHISDSDINIKKIQHFCAFIKHYCALTYTRLCLLFASLTSKVNTQLTQYILVSKKCQDCFVMQENDVDRLCRALGFTYKLWTQNAFLRVCHYGVKSTEGSFNLKSVNLQCALLTCSKSLWKTPLTRV